MSEIMRNLKDLFWQRAFEAGMRQERRRIVRAIQEAPANYSRVKLIELIKGKRID